MDCSDAREAISALLDEEAIGVSASELSVHVSQCADCDIWRENAHRITRRVRLTPARPVPNVDQALLAAIRGELDERPRTRFGLMATRLGLVVIAIAQIALTLPALIFGTDHEAPLHVAHEIGSFGMALAIGFLVVAWQPARARGMHALVGAAALLLLVTAAVDLLAGGRTSISDEAPHLLVVLGWMLMYRLAALAPLESDDGWGRRILGGWRTASASRDAQIWARLAPEHDTGAVASDVERRTASG